MNDKLYFAASIWPFMGVFIHAIDPHTGEILWTNSGDGTNLTVQPHGAPSFATVVPQGHLVATNEMLIVPGGRSVPAVYDANVGHLRHFQFDKRNGGHEISATANLYFTNTQLSYRLENGKPAKVAAPTFIGDQTLVYAKADEVRITSSAGMVGTITETDRKGVKTVNWTVKYTEKNQFKLAKKVDKWLCQAGSAIYGWSKQHGMLAYDTTQVGQTVQPFWTHAYANDIVMALAGNNRLFLMDSTHRLHCLFESPHDVTSGSGPDGAIANGPQDWHPRRLDMNQWSARITQQPDPMANILKSDGASQQGYAVVLGIGDGRLIRHLLLDTQLHIIAVDVDANLVRSLRTEMKSLDLYGSRIAVHVGTPSQFPLPPYLANIIVTQQLTPTVELVRHVFHALRPYGGAAYFSGDSTESHVRRIIEQLDDPQAQLEHHHTHFVLRRPGRLADADDWTHQYANAAQTVFSNERRVKAPLGVLWFGGQSNKDVLPRHGHGPSPQVAAGRLIIEGVNMLRAVDVYTGRLLWQKSLPGVGKYYNTTSHFAGAGAIGSNYVSLADNVYVVYGPDILELDAANGETLRSFRLQTTEGQQPPNWGSICVDGDYLIATSSPVEIKFVKAPAEAPPDPVVTTTASRHEIDDRLGLHRYASSSRRLVVFDRRLGKLLWKRDSQFSFRHNNIVTGAGKLFCIDSMTSAQLDVIRRRGFEVIGKPTLMALDLASGKPIWETQENVSGTFLHYSARHDMLIQAGSAYRDRALDESGVGIRALRGADGEVLWEQSKLKYGGPCLILDDRILTNGGGGFAIDIHTGKSTGWRYTRAYGCNTAIGCPNLLTFRSGAAGFFDLLGDSGTGNFGGFRSSCTNNLIPANGVLNAPDYTRTCSCAYQNQTSLALIHMPDVEFWTFGGKRSNDRVGINLGAPGDRRSDEGTLWVDVPSVGGQSEVIDVAILPKQPKYFRLHSSQLAGGRLKWVAASGVIGANEIRIKSPAKGRLQLRLVFMEPDSIGKGERVFDVSLQGKPILTDFDIADQAGGSLRSIEREFSIVSDGGPIVLSFASKTALPCLICGIEITVESTK
jgi:outer membrane protein assembly factor BamB